MKNQEIKYKDSENKYSILIGKNILNTLSNRVKILCPKAKKIAVVDRNVPQKFKSQLKINLKNLHLFFKFNANEKVKSLKSVDYYLNKLSNKNFNRSDLVIAMGGGITGIVGFISSIFKRE